MTTPGVTAATRLLAVLGDPVGHSLSPVIQNAALRATGRDGVYVALRCDAPSLEGLVRGIARAGGAGNVTLPHKERTAALLDAPSPAVARTGACNTFWSEDGCLHGDNTDVEGFRRALAALLGGPPTGQTVLLLGAGGAARAALVALLEDGAREVRVLNRSVERARGVLSQLGNERTSLIQDARESDDGAFDLVVNTTRLGLRADDPLPLDLERLSGVGAVMDLVYGKAPTRFVDSARTLGIPAADGAEMLVQQGAAAFERWWGAPAPVAAMREALEQERAR
jgi:shikimate dehydrogenase